MDFWIVASDHELQLVKNTNDSAKRKAQKEQLEALASDPRIPWKNISTTDAEREAAGIADALKNRPGHPDYETMET